MFSSYDFSGFFFFPSVHKLFFPILLMLNMLAELSSKNIFFKQSLPEINYFFFFLTYSTWIKDLWGLLSLCYDLFLDVKRLHYVAGLLFFLMYSYYYLATYWEILPQTAKSRTLTSLLFTSSDPRANHNTLQKLSFSWNDF